jgi:hypothetical protein
MSIVKSESRENFFRIEDGVVLKPPKTLLALYQRKGLDVARAGDRSPFSDSNDKRKAS